MITRYGVDVVRTFFLAAIILLVAVFLLTDIQLVRGAVVLIVGAAAMFVLNFFRDPERVTPQGTDIIVAPADGKIVLVRDVVEPEYIKSDAVQVSIFMSPLNVHVNRFPMTGMVGYFRYIPGEYIVAFDDKSSERNERTHIGIEQSGYKILIKQIAGAVARRIVAPVAEGQAATIGERFGMIKFGSRVDVLMPLGTDIKVRAGDRTVAGETVIATYAPAGRPDGMNRN